MFRILLAATLLLAALTSSQALAGDCFGGKCRVSRARIVERARVARERVVERVRFVRR